MRPALLKVNAHLSASAPSRKMHWCLWIVDKKCDGSLCWSFCSMFFSFFKWAIHLHVSKGFWMQIIFFCRHNSPRWSIRLGSCWWPCQSDRNWHRYHQNKVSTQCGKYSKHYIVVDYIIQYLIKTVSLVDSLWSANFQIFLFLVLDVYSVIRKSQSKHAQDSEPEFCYLILKFLSHKASRWENNLSFNTSCFMLIC